MLQTESTFPHVGALAFRRGTAEPARVIRCNADGTILIERRQRASGARSSSASGSATMATTVPLSGAAANTTVDAADLFSDEQAAIWGSARRAAKARRTRAAKGRP